MTIYVYVLDTLADWELGFVTSELNSGRFFKKGAQKIPIKTVSYSKAPITTMGGMTILPDCLIEEMEISKENTLLLPGADTWSNPKHLAIIEKANKFLSIGATVGAICGATTALANFGLLDKRSHTSNGAGFLEMFCPNYKGQHFFVDELSIIGDNLITASSAGSLLWARQILEHLDVFQSDTLDSWYDYFSTGNAEHFFELMKTLPSNE